MCLYGTALWSNYNLSSMTLLSSCYNKCLKYFFGFSKYYSVKAMLLELQIPCLETLLHNAKHTLRQMILRCNNELVQMLLNVYPVNLL